MVQKRSHPKFLRPNYGRSSRSRIKLAWRRPRGIDNKKRLKIKYMGASPSIGYRQPREIRYEHPSGMQEVLVQTPSELAGLKEVAVRIASGVGRKKREEIIRLAEGMKLRVLNKAKKYAPKPEKKIDGKRTGEAKKQEEKKEQLKTSATAPAALVQKQEETKNPEAKLPAEKKPEANLPGQKDAVPIQKPPEKKEASSPAQNEAKK